MAENHVGSHIAFDRGIDQVTYARLGESQSLPQRREEAPSELGGRPQLESLLAQPTLDGMLEEAIRPRLENRDLLVPSRFQAALDSVHAAISEKAENNPAGTDQFGSPEERRVLQRAVRLLSNERDLRGLVQMYRSVLYQG
ncbi:hypothetical protein [Ottowia thiooxydans]|uniref:type III secretion apparatus assembly protein SctX n=1 Tax=Ottowia thiooxydans TaxID=219182 RepID=UPI000422BC90|nr:hypothetical protein [Ottowia thiooxydans]